jgi:hypothetical protein
LSKDFEHNSTKRSIIKKKRNSSKMETGADKNEDNIDLGLNDLT